MSTVLPRNRSITGGPATEALVCFAPSTAQDALGCNSGPDLSNGTNANIVPIVYSYDSAYAKSTTPRIHKSSSSMMRRQTRPSKSQKLYTGPCVAPAKFDKTPECCQSRQKQPLLQPSPQQRRLSHRSSSAWINSRVPPPTKLPYRPSYSKNGRTIPVPPGVYTVRRCVDNTSQHQPPTWAREYSSSTPKSRLPKHTSRPSRHSAMQARKGYGSVAYESGENGGASKEKPAQKGGIGTRTGDGLFYTLILLPLSCWYNRSSKILSKED